MAIPIVSDQQFASGAKITGLPPATAAGQPLTFEQLGGIAPPESAIITIPRLDGGSRLWDQEVSRPGTSPSQSCECWFASTSIEDENEIDMLQGVTIQANCGVDKIVFSLASPDIEIGEFKIKYRIS
jgi:hypothetical protein